MTYTLDELEAHLWSVLAPSVATVEEVKAKKIWASTSLTLHRLRFACLGKLNIPCKWYSKFYGNVEVHFIVIPNQN